MGVRQVAGAKDSKGYMSIEHPKQQYALIEGSNIFDLLSLEGSTDRKNIDDDGD